MSNICPKCQHNNPDDTVYCGKCAALLRASEDFEVTSTIEAPKEELTTGSTFAGRYQIIEELGKGGMGKVYKVHDTKIKEKIALKLIKPEIAKDKKTIERFSNELRLARKIRHKNVCQMFDLGEEKGTQFITMEYVSGEDLRSSIRRFGQLPIGKSISIANQICEGLAEAHRQGVVHRDLKSNNIMIDKEGNVRIMDFGIARSLEAKGITAAGVMIGTPEYMSPEQVEGKDVDQRSDVYSLGIVLYEMVTGRVPFEGDTPFTVGVKHKSETPKDPKELNSQISEDLSLIILRCLEKEKEKRYQSAGELRSELKSIEKGIPASDREIPKKKPLTSKEITVTFGLKKLFIPALIFITIVIIGIILWQVLPKEKTLPLVPSDKPSLAIMYFENNTGDESLDHYRKAISDLLITDLGQSKYIRVLSGARLFNILGQLDQLEVSSYSSEVLKQVAARGGVGVILSGNYTKAGDIFRINFSLLEADTAEHIGSEGAEGRGVESIFAMVDELTRKIKKNFKLSPEEIATDIDKQIGKITTSSPEAYKYFSEGVKHANMAAHHKAIQFFKKAVAIDPEFSTAFRGMATEYSNLGYISERRKYLQKAFELTNRVSDRERYRTQGDYYRLMSEKTYDKAIEAYNKLLELYPGDYGGNHSLGQLYRYLEKWDEAIEQYEVNIRNKQEAYYSYGTQAYAYMAKGLYDRAREVLENYLNNFSDNTSIRYYLANTYIYQGKYDLALAEVDKSMSIYPAYYQNFRQKGDFYLYKGDLIKAEKEYRKLLDLEEKTENLDGRESLAILYLLQGKFEKAKDLLIQVIELARKFSKKQVESNYHIFLANIYIKSGKPDKALKECDKAWSGYVETEYFPGQRFVLFYKGLAYLKMKSMDEAQRTADELKEMIEIGMNKKEIRYYYHLRGMIELDRENFSNAIENLKEATSLLSSQHLRRDEHALFIDPLALAYYKQGELEKAREEYERITSLTTGRLADGDIYAKSFYMLGKIYEQQGNTAKAIENYEKFLVLWKDADPGIAEVEDAKKSKGGE